MIYAQRGNRITQIKEEDIQRYVNEGYAIKDENGSVIVDTAPTDIKELQKAYRDHIKEIKVLMDANEALKKEIAELKAKPKAEPKAESKDEAEEVKPKSRAKKADA